MGNQVTIKQDPSVVGTFKASAFNAQGVVVPGDWQEFNVNGDMVWDPGKYGYSDTTFYIGKGIGPDADNPFVAYAVKIDFTDKTGDATVTLGIAQVSASAEGNNPCNIFTATGNGVDVKIIKDGNPVADTELPSRCS